MTHKESGGVILHLAVNLFNQHSTGLDGHCVRSLAAPAGKRTFSETCLFSGCTLAHQRLYAIIPPLPFWADRGKRAGGLPP